jgi:MoCo/4Fe-4S cofactor protein with predicted Tat translocation signal
MKRDVQHPAPPERELTGPQYWRSLDELAATPGFKAQLEREFPEGASEIGGVDRRHFMKIMAASFALGGIGLAGCRRPEMHILPYGKSVEGIIPGLPQYYATAMPLRKSAIPLLAETHQGRPTKVEGNPSYEPHGGAASLLAQASVLDLYDPDRATAHTRGGAILSREQVDRLLADITQNYSGAQGAGLAFLAEESSSPTRARLIGALRRRFPRAMWAEYEPIRDEPPLAAAQAAFGANVKPLHRFARAKRILSVDADFLQAEAGSLYYARSFANGRRVSKPDDPMNRLYIAESALTLTGSMADHRLRLPTSHMLAFVAAVAARLSPRDTDTLATLSDGVELNTRWIDECVADLREHRGECVVVAGSHLPAQVHALVHGINAELGNIGRTVDFVAAQPSTAASIGDLAAQLRGGMVKTLVILGGNPVYNAPADLDWPELQRKVPEVVRFGYYVDETSALASTHLAAAHYLESWGDARTVDGTIVPIQPMILPLFGGLTELEVIARIAGEEKTDPYDLVFASMTAAAANPEKAMRRFLHDGLIEGSAYPRVNVTFNRQGVGALFRTTEPAPTPGRDNLEVRFIADARMDDGRFANNGWLQECPEAISRISWGNAIFISPRLAKELGVYPQGSLVQVARIETAGFNQGKEIAFIGELTLNGRTVRAPMHIQPGLANYTLVLPLGHGRTRTGSVGRNSGHDFYPLRTSAAPHFAVGAKLVATKDTFALANTQEHWSMEGRDIVREANLDEYRETPHFVNTFGMESHSPSILGEYGEKMSPQERATLIPRGNSLYQTPNAKQGHFDSVHQWGMSIDMNTCIGCQACVVACQAENNVPIVGKDQVLRGREMHWLRIDRYYSNGTIDAEAFGGPGNKEIPEDLQVSLQPMACVHCELAPCETVCPVNATVHDEEGLNVMAYNRCIGTRYCANNCPYKVRRFNFFDWNQRRLDSLYLGPAGPYGMPELIQLLKNPEVSIRMRGVMEKCTYCVQRIQNGKIQHKVKMAQQGRPGDVMVPDGIIKTACQQTCPVDAIVFGNIMDKDSALMKAKAREQDYAVLGYLNTRPRTTYSGRVRNPNPKMPDYHAMPLSRVEYKRKNYPARKGEGHQGHGHTAQVHGGKKGGR